MADPRYQPRLPEIRTDASLRAEVSADRLYSFDEQHAAYVARPSGAGEQYTQLAHALSRWEPALDRTIQQGAEEERELWLAKGQHLANEEANLKKSFTELTREQPEYLGYSPAFKEGYTSVQMQNLGLAYETALTQAYHEKGWVNLPQQELQKARQEFTASWRAEHLAPYLGGEEDEVNANYPLLTKHFNPLQARAENGITGMYTEGRAKIHFAEGEQAFMENAYATIDGFVRSGNGAFFGPGTEQNANTLAAYLTAQRDHIMASGVPAYMANEWIKKSLVQYATKMDIEANDYRAEALFSVLDHIPTGTGRLGQTAASQLALAEFKDSSTDRRFKEESRYWQRRHWEKQEAQEKASTALITTLSENPEARYEDILAAHNIPPTPENLALYNTIRKQQADAWEAPETAENGFLAAELFNAAQKGEITLSQLFTHYRAGRITTSQWNDLRIRFPEGGTSDKRIESLMRDANFSEAKNFVQNAWQPTAEEKSLGLTPERQVETAGRSHVASVMFESAVRRELLLVEQEKGSPATRDEAVRIIERHRAIMSDTQNNLAVPEAAKANKDNAFRFDNLQLPSNAYQEANERGGWEGFTPAPDSALAHAPARSLRLVEGAAREAGIDPLLAFAVAQIESSFNENAKNPASSATGLMQLTAATAQDMKVNPRNPQQNALGGAKRIAQIQQLHNTTDPATIYRYYHDGPWHSGPHSAEAEAGAAMVRELHGKLRQEHAVQQEARIVTQYTHTLAEVCPTQAETAAVALALTNNKPHDVLKAMREEAQAKGGDLNVPALKKALNTLFDQQQAAAASSPAPPNTVPPRRDDESWFNMPELLDVRNQQKDKKQEAAVKQVWDNIYK